MYIEGLGSASVANGVLRIETFVRNARGEDVNGPDLLLPVARAGHIADFLRDLIAQLRQQEAGGDASPQPSGEQPSVERMVY